MYCMAGSPACTVVLISGALSPWQLHEKALHVLSSSMSLLTSLPLGLKYMEKVLEELFLEACTSWLLWSRCSTISQGMWQYQAARL